MATPIVLGAVGLAASSPQVGIARVQDYWTAVVALVGLCLLAYLTNPNPASFRTHLTSQSFHTHLRRLSSSPTRSSSVSSPSANPEPQPGGTPSSINGQASSAAPNNVNGKRKTSVPTPSTSIDKSSSFANRHILSFSNRISLSIKTPSYSFTSYYLFSAVYVPPSRSSGAAGTTKRQQQQLKKHPELGALLGLGGELWLGLFGKWYALKLWDNEVQEEDERRGRLEKGVKEMVVENDDKDLDSSNPVTASASGSSTPGQHFPSPLDRSSSLSSQHGDFVPPLSPTSKNGPAAARLAKRVFRAGQRRSSPTSLTRLKTKAEHAAREAAEAERLVLNETTPAASASSSAEREANGVSGIAAGLSRVTTTDPVLLELQSQLDELRESAAEGEKRLQEELEILRGKKRDEDTFRAELKARTKTLEETKRSAEAAKVEAEKELGERKGAIKEVQGRVDKLREEIRALERKGMEVVERKEKKKRDRREREKKLRDDVGKKRDELKEREQGLEDVIQQVGEMERKLEVRRALLSSRRTELAQLAVTGVRAVAPVQQQNGGPVYAIAPPPAPATSTLGGVGAVANAFAAPFSHGQYGRRNYPYVHPLSANNSRPTSIRSGHFDPHTGAFQSAPSSPTFAHPVSPHDEALAQYNSDASGWPSSFGPTPSATSGGSATNQQLTHPGFLEHRLQHRAATSNDDPHSGFLPFDFDSHANGHEASPPLRTRRAGSLTAADDYSPGAGKPRPPLALPLQYLDSGLLANTMTSGMDSPSVDTGPLSPMTPHQASLIPSQLFHMLDEDEDDDGLFVMPDSPTLRGQILAGDWQGLGLNLDNAGASRRSSGSKEDGVAIPASVPEEEEEEDVFEEAPERKDSPVVISPRAETFPSLSGATSATSSPIGPPPASPYSPWDAAAPGAPSLALEPPSQTILHRLSPSQDIADDLPRAGLSLNPGAKAFAFPFTGGVQGTHTRTSSVPSPPTLHAAIGTARPARSGTTSALPSPTTTAPPSSSLYSLEPPAKSRMDFANRSSLDAPLSARLSPGIDWPIRATSSPKVAAPVAPIGTAAVGGGGTSSGGTTPVAPSTLTVPSVVAPAGASSFNPFNPFDQEDELLGPLKK